MTKSIRDLLRRTGITGTVLSALLLAALSIWIFLEVAEAVTAGETRHIDEWALQALRQPGDPSKPIGPWWMASIGRDITSLGSFTVLALVSLCVIGFLAFSRKWETVALVFISVTGGMILSSVLKGVFDRPRPELVPELVETYTSSFPSGHSMASAVTYLTLATILSRTMRRWRLKLYFIGCAVVLAGAIGLTRVYLGVHYPSDVVAGWCAGLAWSLLCDAAARQLQRRGAIEAPTQEA